MSEQRPVALVTGSTSGIGEGIVRRLAAEGFHVVVHSRTSEDTGRRIADELDGIYLRADLSVPEQAGSLVETAVGSLGSLDVLVNNAGISWPIPHEDLEAVTPEVWHQMLEVNLVAPWMACAAAAPYLRRSGLAAGGCIVNITSHAGVRPKGASIPYAASKAALNHVTRLLATTLGPQVRVNAIAPGLVDTPLTASWTEAHHLWETRSPMARPAQPSDVADLTYAVITNRYLTGEVIVLDGGMNLT